MWLHGGRGVSAAGGPTLHCVRRTRHLTRRIERHVRLHARVVAVYLGRRSSIRWIRFRVVRAELQEMAAHAGLVRFGVAATHASACPGALDAALAEHEARSVDDAAACARVVGGDSPHVATHAGADARSSLAAQWTLRAD